MKVAIFAFLLVGIATLAMSSDALAAGGKVRADDVAGPAYQLGETPFSG